MTSTVVVGVDGSEASLAAARWAAAEAASRAGDLRVLCAANEDTGESATLWTSPQLVRRDATEVAGAAVAAAGAAFPGLPTSVEVVVGDPVDELLAASRAADVLVVGSRGLGAFTGLLLGSVSERLARAAACPAVVVRGDGADRTGPVVIGVDGAPETAAAVEFAVATADRHRVGLTVLTAVPPIWPGSSSSADPESHSGVAGQVRTMQEGAVRSAVAGHPGVPIEHRIELAGAAGALVEASEGAGLVVLGRSGSGGRLRSVSGHVLRHAACPVAVVPAGDG